MKTDTQLMGIVEIAHLLGVSRQRAHQLVNRDNFPAPLDTLQMGRVWDRKDVLAWEKKVRPAKSLTVEVQ